MKKMIFIISLLILVLSGCADKASNDPGKPSDTELSAVQIAENIVKACDGTKNLSKITPEDDNYSLWLTDFYNIPAEYVTDGAVYYAEGAQADEIAVFELTDERDTESVKTALSEYKDSRVNSFEGYAPGEAAKVRNGIVTANGKFTALFICSDPSLAESAFSDCFKIIPPVTENSSNTSPTSEETSDTSGTQNESSAEPTLSSETQKPQSLSLMSTSVSSSQSPQLSSSSSASASNPQAPQSSSSSNTGASSPQSSQSLNSSSTSASSSQSSQSSSSSSTGASSSQNSQSSGSSSSSSSSSKPLEEIRPTNGYDRAAVLLAWQTGDDSKLSDINKQILKAAKSVISNETKNGMSGYEKELAVHDWITHNCVFDYGVFDRGSSGYANNSDNPYGVLINGSAMCHGYSSTFQLFMDMLDIECITVFGNPSGGTQHSWNMVKLDGEWYCVDAAWDDPIGGSPCHTYFNVTSDYLRSRGIHRWDESAVPEATADKYAYH